MKKRSLSLLLASCLSLGLLNLPAGAEEGYLPSGDLNQPKLTREEIVQLLENAPTDMPDEVFDVEPSCVAPYVAGRVSDKALQAALDRLNAVRRIAGVPAVTLDLTLCDEAQYGAVIQGALGGLSHYPAQPEDMEDDFYQKARAAASTSNLSAGRTLISSVDALLQDSGGSNLTSVGHRRWQLNPDMGKVGFGYAVSNTVYRTYVDEKVFDRSGAGCDYNFIAWPASGDFPHGFMHSETPWSVTLNPERYAAPDRDEVTVTLTRESDGQVWSFAAGESYTTASSGKYFNVDNAGYGVNNCIIFRPDGVEKYEGIYTVTVSGVKTRAGQAAHFSYQVEFVDPRQVERKAPTIVSEGNDPLDSGVAYPATQTVLVDGEPVEFQMYALLNDSGAPTNYVKLRDVADVLDGTKAQFNVTWTPEAGTTVTTKTPYIHRNGKEGVTEYTGEQDYMKGNPTTRVDEFDLPLQSFTLQNGSYTYYKLRDLGQALGFNVCWDSKAGRVIIETDKPYDGQNR